MKFKYARKLAPFVSFLLGISATLLFLVYLAFETNSTRSAVVDTRTGINYVLVNEDLGGSFYGINYNFGSEFISLVNQDVANDWQTSSRGVAEAGFSAGNFDVMIMLPQNFTERLLSLESFSPEAVQIDYAVRLGQNEITNALVYEQVSAILDDFNQRIVQMYFSTILGSLFDAQLNVSQVISDESVRHQLLVSDIEAPFADIPMQFSRVVEDANLLSGESDIWVSEQNVFNEQAQEMLTLAAEGFSNQLTDLEGYIELLNMIADRNHQNVQFVLSEQSQTDEQFYYSQFSGFNQSLMTSLNLFDDGCHDETMSCNHDTIMRRFVSTGEVFENSQNLLIADFESQIESLALREKAHMDALKGEVQEILSLRNQIAYIYFGDSSLTPETVSDDDIKKLILDMITITDDTNNELEQVYLEVINDYLEQIAPDDLGDMLSAFYNQNMITKEQYDLYQARLEIISRFADEEGIELNKNVNFAFVDVEDVQIDSIIKFPHISTFMIEPLVDQEQLIHLKADSNVSIHEIEEVRKAIEYDIEQKLSQVTEPLEVEVLVVDDQNQTISVRIFEDNKVQPQREEMQPDHREMIPDRKEIKPDLLLCTDEDDCPEHDDIKGDLSVCTGDDDCFKNEETERQSPICTGDEECPGEPEGSVPQVAVCPNASRCPQPDGQVPERPLCTDDDSCIELAAFNVTVQMELAWDLRQTQLETSFITTEFDWLLNDEIIFSGHLSKIVSHYEQSLATDLSLLMDQLSLVENASRQIVTLFGAPAEASQTIFGFIEDVKDDALTIREHAPYDSIYQRYGTLTDEELQTFILDNLAPFFKEQGTELFNELSHRYEGLLSAMNVFYDGTPILAFEALHDRMMPGDSLLAEVQALHDWQQETRTELEAAYESWQQSEVLEMELRVHSGGNLEEAAAINYDVNVGEGLVGNANTAVTTLEENLGFIEASMSESEDLSDWFTSLVDQTKGVSTQVEQISSNLETLNARFINDISANESFSENFSRVMQNARIGGADNPEVLGFLASPVDLHGAIERAEATSIASLYLTIIASMLILVSSYGFRYFESRKEVSKADELVSLSLPTLNKIAVLKLLIMSILVGLLFGIITRNVAGIPQSLWIFWMTSLVSTGILVVTYFSRQFPRFTLLMSALLFVSYLLLTPFLGVQIEPDTLVAHLFNASPLQKFESIAQSLTTGGQVRIIILPLILLISMVGVVLNLYVKINLGSVK